MSRFSGKSGSITFTTPSTAHNLGLTSWEVNMKGDAIDVTGMDSAGVKQFIAGCTEWSGSFEGNVDGTLAALLPGVTITAFTLASSSTTGAPKFTNGANASLIITDVKVSTSVDGAVKCSCAFQGSGTLTVGTV